MTSPNPEHSWIILLAVGIVCAVLGYYGAGFKDWPLCRAEQVELSQVQAWW